jgi:hypothetical protein
VVGLAGSRAAVVSSNGGANSGTVKLVMAWASGNGLRPDLEPAVRKGVGSPGCDTGDSGMVVFYLEPVTIS